jgi:uncharacterized membrane protein YeaQ/YmgE (transglycosylase-associated protein family)
MFSLIGTMIAGLVVGALAKFLMPGKDPGGMFVTMLIGIAGSMAGSWIGQQLGFYGPGETAGWIMSVIGAIVLLFGYRLIRSRA